MKITIRSKLVFAISLLMVVIFSFAAYLFIGEKKVEMADDIYFNSLAFAKLTAVTIAENYDLYLDEGGFVYFNREIKTIFEQNDDIASVKVVTYDGEILYDSAVDIHRKYDGELRSLKDSGLLKQVRSENIAIQTIGDVKRSVYLKQISVSESEFVDELENKVEVLESGVLLDYFVVPASEKYAVIYNLDYHNLEERVAIMMTRMIYLALFGILLGMILSFFMSTQVTKPVSKLVIGAEGIARGDFKTRVDIKTSDEIGFLGKAFNQMAIDLEASIEAKLYKERVTAELEMATKIQNQIIPDKTPEVNGIDIAAGIDPAGEIGGDMYDFLQLDKDKLLMYLGDVTGHGVPAGIVSSIASALFYGFAHTPDLVFVMSEANRVLKVKTMTNMFMTVCLLEWDIATQKLSYVSAGHEQLIHYQAKTGKAVLLPAGGIALGMLPDISKMIRVNPIDFQPGDFVISYSDGIPEAWKNEKELYGMERFVAAVEKSGKSQTAEMMKDSLLRDVHAFRAGYEQKDDITILVMKKT